MVSDGLLFQILEKGNSTYLIEDYRATLQSKGVSPNTETAYIHALGEFLQYLSDNGQPTSPKDITPHQVERFLASLRSRITNRKDASGKLKPYSDATRHAYFRALKTWFSRLVKQGEIEFSPMADGKVEAPILHERPMPTAESADIDKVLQLCDPKHYPNREQKFAMVRNSALIVMYWDTGSRLASIANLQLEDLDLPHNLITVTVKGGHTKQKRIGWRAKKELIRYLRERGELPHHSVWVNSRTRQPMTAGAVGDTLADLFHAAGTALTVHGIKRGVASYWAERGLPEGIANDLMDWSPGSKQYERYLRARKRKIAMDTHAKYSPGDTLRMR